MKKTAPTSRASRSPSRRSTSPTRWCCHRSNGSVQSCRPRSSSISSWTNLISLFRRVPVSHRLQSTSRKESSTVVSSTLSLYCCISRYRLNTMSFSSWRWVDCSRHLSSIRLRGRIWPKRSSQNIPTWTKQWGSTRPTRWLVNGRAYLSCRSSLNYSRNKMMDGTMVSRTFVTNRTSSILRNW